jgi:hypothetical protein
MTRLSGEQIHEFTEALLDAYLTHNDLRMLAHCRLYRGKENGKGPLGLPDATR